MNNLLPKNWQFDTACLTDIDGDGKWLCPPLVDLGLSAIENQAMIANGFLYGASLPNAKTVSSNKTVSNSYGNHLDGQVFHNYELLAMSHQDQLSNIGKAMVGVTNGDALFNQSMAERSSVNDDVLWQALNYAKSFGQRVFLYPNNPSLTKNGVAHDGFVATFHGLAGISPLAETTALAKQLLLVQELGLTAHFGRLSCERSVQMIADAKASGLDISCDVAMHQLFLTENNLIGFNTNAYVLPPLRSEQDRQALLGGLKDGTIDAICSHHQPLPATAKLAPFAESTAGISTVDTFVALGCQLVADGVLSANTLIEKIAINPAKILGIELSYLQTSQAILIDPAMTWCVNESNLHSVGKNTPFLGQTLTGKVVGVYG